MHSDPVFVPILLYPFEKELLSTTRAGASGPFFLPEYDGYSEKLNSNGYRSDDFIANHAGKQHVLFSGCSYTFPDGLTRQEGWAWKTWKDLKNTSGFFNLAELGANIPNIVLNIFKYCKQYGTPDKIFLLLPDNNRYLEPFGKDSSVMVHTPLPEKINRNYVNIMCFQYYEMLEIFCKINNIDLVSFSWDPETDKLLKNFDTFFVMDKKTMLKDAYRFESTMKDKTYAINARGKGNGHPGIAVQHAYYLALKRHLAY